MLTTFAKITLIVPPIGLAVMLVYGYGLLGRSINRPQLLKAVMGVLFGVAAALGMAAPFQIADGIIVDIRNLFIGIAAAYFGLLGGAIALIIGIAMRLDIGGVGMMTGISAMIVASLMGSLWANVVHPKIKKDWHGQVILAGMISVHLIVAVFLPNSVRSDFLTGLAPILAAANLIGTLLLGQMIQREQALIEEKNRLLTEVATDPLTKLVNRKSAATSFAKLPALHDPALGQAMLCIDIDGFKKINDTHGHVCGDSILVIISERLTACLRPVDIFSRISGDEFLIVLHGITSEHALAISERCRAAIGDDQVIVDGKSLWTSISIGSVWTQKLTTFKGLRERADDALYNAKNMGRNRVCFQHDMPEVERMTAAVA